MPISRLHFEEELNRIHHDLLAMGTRVEEDLRKAVLAARDCDTGLAQDVIADDAVVNAMQVKIEDQAAVLLATQQPVARDLRELVATIKTVADLERIGDFAVHLSKTVIKLKDGPDFPVLAALADMGELAVTMLRQAMQAMLNHDEVQARQAAALDQEIDTRHRSVVQDILRLAQQHPERAAETYRLLRTANFLERLGDHVGHICENTVYMLTGAHIELDE
jgi:phosphate transport system protein